MRPALRMALASTAFAVLHSALASEGAKRCAACLLGERQQQAFYRPFYIVQALLSFGTLLLYGARLPSRTLYRLEGTGAALLRMGQAAALVQVCRAVQEIGWMRVTGLENLRAWRRGQGLARPPAAQGPEQDPGSGRLRDGGPFRWSRHPLNFLGVPLFWLTPHLTTKRLVFNLLGTLYFLLGSMHEEVRLRRAYGARYRTYEDSGVPFFFPKPPRAAGPGPAGPVAMEGQRPPRS